MKKLLLFLEKSIHYFAITVLLMIVGLMIYAVVMPPTGAEAYIGNFGNIHFNKNWTVILNGEERDPVDLPNYVNCKPGDQLVIKNKLPRYLSNGMSVMFRTALQDVHVYVDGNLRTSYASEDFDRMSYYLPSAYVLVPLYQEDKGREIEICYTVKNTGILSAVTLGQGITPWMDVVKGNCILTFIAIAIVMMGVILAIGYDVLRKKFNTNKALFFLSLIMINMGLWIISESKLRQLIFKRPSLSSIFAYLSIELLGVFILLYFDEIQCRMHHKVYVQLEFFVSLQILCNMILDFTGKLPFKRTLIYSHIWLAAGILVVIINIIIDWIHHQVSRYKAVVVGMGIFLVFASIELFIFYFLKGATLGVMACIGFLIFIVANIIQLFRDITAEYEKNKKKIEESWVNTIQTIAGAIEAKDEYTGGHSERVAHYAAVLARAVAKDYGLTEADIIHIHYVGLLHDIGKIGIPDDILNKTGKLTDEEFSLMKKHVEIGSALMKRVGTEDSHLTEGIRYHHERYDGKGYPDGLKGIKIPFVGRILCIADSYDAMTSSRVYRKRLTDKEVRDEILNCSGKQFDPDLCKTFVELLDQGKLQPEENFDEIMQDERMALRSLVLEKGLKEDEEEKQLRVLNPSHIRFACYAMKLAETVGQKFDVFIIEPLQNFKESNATVEFLHQKPKKFLSTKDLNLRYSENSNLLVFFDRSTEEIQSIKQELEKEMTVVTIKEQTKSIH